MGSAIWAPSRYVWAQSIVSPPIFSTRRGVVVGSLWGSLVVLFPGYSDWHFAHCQINLAAPFGKRDRPRATACLLSILDRSRGVLTDPRWRILIDVRGSTFSRLLRMLYLIISAPNRGRASIVRLSAPIGPRRSPCTAAYSVRLIWADRSRRKRKLIRPRFISPRMGLPHRASLSVSVTFHMSSLDIIFRDIVLTPKIER